jgi:PAS domain S-box-containing protein
VKNRTKFLNLGISILACLILFICLGLSVIGPAPISAFSDSQFDFFVFLSRYGISLAFFLTVLALILLYKHQKMLVKDQEDIARVLSTRSQDSGLDETASMYYRIFNFAPIGVIKSTRNGKVVFCNPMCAWIFGFGGTEEFVEKINSSEQGIRQLYVDPKDREEFFRILDQDRCSWHQIQKQFYRKDGSIFYASVRGSLRQEIDRQEECFFGFIEDISSRIDAEKTLRKSEKNYRDLI